MRVTKGKKPTKEDIEALEVFKDQLIEEFAKRKQRTVWDREQLAPKHPDATQPELPDVPF